MKISRIENTSFGKLYISADKNTKEAVSELITRKDTLKRVRKTLGEIDELSGNRDVYLSGYKYYDKKHPSGTYIFFLNKNIPSWGNVTDTCESEGHFSATLAHLKDLCAKHYEAAEAKVKKADVDKLLYDYSKEKKYKESYKSAELSDDDAFLIPDNCTDEDREHTKKQVSFADTGEPLDLLDIGVNPWSL